MYKKIGLFFIFAFIIFIFFNKVFLKGYVPFPGDLLVGNYEPYKSEFAGVPSKDQGADVIRQLYPWKHFSIESFKQGAFPLWDPYVLSGNPHFANLQSGVLYPLNVVFFLLPFIDGWSAYIILQYLLLLVFTYLYLREIKLSILPSLFGAVTFSFSSFLTVWGEYGNVGHSLAFLPLTLLAIEKLLKERKFFWILLLPFSITLSIFAGYIQLTLYMVILAFFYIFFRNKSEKKKIKKSVFLYVLIILGLLLAGVQLIPLYQLFSNSLRLKYSYSDLLTVRLVPLQNVITLFIPDFFGNPATRNYFLSGSTLERASNFGILPIFMAIFTVFSKKNIFKLFFLSSAILAYILSLSIPPVAFLHSIGIPFLSTGVPTRVLSVFIFSGSVLAAFGLQDVLYSKNKKTLLIVSALIFGFLISAFIFTYTSKDQHFLVSRRNTLLPLWICIIGVSILFIKINRKISCSIIILLTLFELFYSFQKFNSFVPRSYLYPETQISRKLNSIQGFDRSWGYGSANIDTNLQLMEKFYSPDGYDPLILKSYGEFLSASENGKIPKEIPRSVANIFKGYGVNDLKTNPYRKRALDLTSVKYILNKKGGSEVDSAFSQDEFKLLWNNNDWQIYENLGSIPRVKLFGKILLEPDPKKSIKILYDPKFDFKNTLIVANDLGFQAKPDNSSEAHIVSYEPNEIVIKTKSRTPQFLFISDNYMNGWFSNINNTYSPPFVVANYTYKAIPVPQGDNTVTLYYAPFSLWYGLIVSMTALFSLIVLAVFTKIKRV